MRDYKINPNCSVFFVTRDRAKYCCHVQLKDLGIYFPTKQCLAIARRTLTCIMPVKYFPCTFLK